MTSQTQSPSNKDREAESVRLMLDVIETRDRLTQRSLSGELGTALGLTSIYLKRCINKGLVKVGKAQVRRFASYLTARGFAEKARLTTQYLTRSLSYFRVARGDCSELVGAGDLCEIAALDGADPETGPDAVVVTDMKEPQAAYERMVALRGPDRVFLPSLLRPSRPRPGALATAG